MTLRVVELFAGVGGFRIGFEMANKISGKDDYEVIWSNQWEPSTKKQHATEVYVNRWDMEPLSDDAEVYLGKDNPNDIHVNKDINSISVDEIPDFDLLCGGFPCQDYSVAKTANKAIGIQGKKGVLWWDIRRIIEGKKPKIVLLENVDRLLKSPTSQRGRDFAVMLASLDDLGYVVEWRSINAAEYGMPQRRRRVFILAFPKDSEQGKALSKSDPMDYLHKGGIMARTFPIKHSGKVVCPEVEIRKKKESDLSEVSSNFNKGAKKTAKSPFKKCGIMRNGVAYTFDGTPDYNGLYTTLGDILLKPSKIPEEYYIKPDDVDKPKGWKYLKGAKKEQRDGTDGFTYSYNEGPMKFPEPLDNASRTIITGEGGSTPSRFKHVVVFRPPKSKVELLDLKSKAHAAVRIDLNLKANEWIRRLTPIELERLNMFPDNHTEGQTDGKRAFFMGNALVVGIVKKVAISLLSKSIIPEIEYQSHWLHGKGSQKFNAESKEIRKKMNDISVKWDSFQAPSSFKNNDEKIWTKENEIRNLQTWFGKPGKDGEFKPNDMRPIITRDGKSPIYSNDISELLTFQELACRFSKILEGKNPNQVADVFRLLARIRKPSLKCDHIVKGSGEIVWSPKNQVLERIVTIDIDLLELLMVTESIARNEDVLYFDGEKIGPGRQNTVSTIMKMIDLRRGVEKTSEFEKLWTTLTARVQILKLDKNDIIDLLNLSKT